MYPRPAFQIYCSNPELDSFPQATQTDMVVLVFLKTTQFDIVDFTIAMVLEDDDGTMVI